MEILVLFIKFPLEYMDNIRKESFQPKIFRSKLEKNRILVLFIKSWLDRPITSERTLFSQKYSVQN